MEHESEEEVEHEPEEEQEDDEEEAEEAVVALYEEEEEEEKVAVGSWAIFLADGFPDDGLDGSACFVQAIAGEFATVRMISDGWEVTDALLGRLKKADLKTVIRNFKMKEKVGKSLVKLRGTQGIHSLAFVMHVNERQIGMMSVNELSAWARWDTIRMIFSEIKCGAIEATKESFYARRQELLRISDAD